MEALFLVGGLIVGFLVGATTMSLRKRSRSAEAGAGVGPMVLADALERREARVHGHIAAARVDAMRLLRAIHEAPARDGGGVADEEGAQPGRQPIRWCYEYYPDD